MGCPQVVHGGLLDPRRRVGGDGVQLGRDVLKLVPSVVSELADNVPNGDPPFTRLIVGERGVQLMHGGKRHVNKPPLAYVLIDVRIGGLQLAQQEVFALVQALS